MTQPPDASKRLDFDVSVEESHTLRPACEEPSTSLAETLTRTDRSDAGLSVREARGEWAEYDRRVAEASCVLKPLVLAGIIAFLALVATGFGVHPRLPQCTGAEEQLRVAVNQATKGQATRKCWI